MKFYNTISHYYDYIFPYKPQQFNFIKQYLDCNSKILDIGCGTGNLSVELGKYYKQVDAIDLDDEMIKIALEKNDINNLNFHKINMLNIGENFDHNTFDGIISFGNTIVHLKNVEEIARLITQCNQLLKPGGFLLIQIINYDRIIKQGIDFLPTIENDKIRFERSYELINERINFKTKLTVKDENRIIDNSVFLLPLRSNSLERILKKNGFGEIQFYGNFKQNMFNKNSIPLIISAEKQNPA